MRKGGKSVPNVKKIGKVLIGILVAAVIVGVLFLYGYSSYIVKQVYGPEAGTFEAWRSYLSSIFSKFPVIKNFVKYEPMNVLSADEYFKKVFEEYKQELEKRMEELDTKEKELKGKEQSVDQMLNSLKSIETSWKESRLKEEISKLDEEISTKRIDEMVKTFAESDPNQIRRLMNADNMSVETLALILYKLSPDIRAELLQSLATVNPTKAAAVTEQIGGVDKLYADIEQKIFELNNRLKELVNIEAEIVNIDGFNKGIISFLDSLTYEEVSSIAFKLRDRPEIVVFLLSKLPNDMFVRLLKDIKDKDEELFINVLSRGARF